MSIKKCCDPFSLKRHDTNWVSYLDVLQVSSKFLEEYFEFIPVKLEKDAFLCKACRTRIEKLASKCKQCCNPLNRHPHKTKAFREINEDLQEKLLYFKDKLPIGKAICTRCRIDVTKICDDSKELINICINPFNIDKHNIGHGGRKVTSEFIDKFPNYADKLQINRKICNSCRMKLSRPKFTGAPTNDSSPETLEIDSALLFITSRKPEEQELVQGFTIKPHIIATEVETEDSDSGSGASNDYSVESKIDKSLDKFLKIEGALKDLNNSIIPFNMPPVTQESNFNEVYDQCKIELKKRLDILSKTKLAVSPQTCDDCENLLSSAIDKFSTSDRRQKYTMLTSISKRYSKKRL